MRDSYGILRQDNLFEVPVDKINSAQFELTFFDGQVVYQGKQSLPN